MSVFGRLLRPLTRRLSAVVVADAEARNEALAARLEAHVLNVADHQAERRDESLRRVIDEVRTNTAFLADSVIALERGAGRGAAAVHAAVTPIVHRARTIAATDHVVLCEHVDPTLVAQLCALGSRVTVVRPVFEMVLPPEVALASERSSLWPGPDGGADVVVWVARERLDAHDVDRALGWLAAGGAAVLAAPAIDIGAHDIEQSSHFVLTPDGYRRSPDESGDLLVLLVRP